MDTSLTHCPAGAPEETSTCDRPPGARLAAALRGCGSNDLESRAPGHLSSTATFKQQISALDPALNTTGSLPATLQSPTPQGRKHLSRHVPPPAAGAGHALGGGAEEGEKDQAPAERSCRQGSRTHPIRPGRRGLISSSEKRPRKVK